MSSFTFRTANDALPVLCKEVLSAEEVGSRVGRTRELAHTHVTITEPWRREILVPGRHASLPAQIAESMWVLYGRNDIEWLSHYLPRAPEFSDDGVTWRGAYGPRMRSWMPGMVDQLEHVVELLCKDHLSRRAVIQIYDPVFDTQPGKDIPCNDWLHFQSRLGLLDMHVAVRSNDLIWGWSGINAFEWSFLQEIIASMLGLGVGQLHFSISSLHIYDKHWAKAERLSEQTGASYPTKHIRFDPGKHIGTVSDLDAMVDNWFRVESIIREKGPGYAVSEILDHWEPLTRAWLWVLAYYWSRDRSYLESLGGTTLYDAALQSPKRPLSEVKKEDRQRPNAFENYVCNLHNEKHAAYGDSWKKRGEMLGIMANIARKIDRLGQNGAGETAADTAIDLLVYLAKYRWWLFGELPRCPAPMSIEISTNDDEAELANELIRKVAWPPETTFETAVAEDWLTKTFDRLEDAVLRKDTLRWEIVDDMLPEAYGLARRLWESESLLTDDGSADYLGADHE